MLTVEDIIQNRDLKNFANFGLIETPVYAKVGDLMLEIGEISQTQIMTPDGQHDVIVFNVSEKSVPEV